MADPVVALACTLPTPAVAREGRLAFVSSEAEGNVRVVDLETEQVVATLPAGQVPHAMAVAPGGTIFVNNRGSNELTVIDATDPEGGTVPLPAVSFQLAMSPDGKLLAVA